MVYLSDEEQDDVTLTEEEAALCRLTRKGIIEQLKNNPHVSPEDIARTLFAIVDSYARSLPTDNKAKQVITEDAALLLKTADSLRY